MKNIRALLKEYLNNGEKFFDVSIFDESLGNKKIDYLSEEGFTDIEEAKRYIDTLENDYNVKRAYVDHT